MTINKSQGQTVKERLGVWLRSPVFSHGLLYVALSRAQKADNVRVLCEPYETKHVYVPETRPDLPAGQYVFNMVNPDLLDRTGFQPQPASTPPLAPEADPSYYGDTVPHSQTEPAEPDATCPHTYTAYPASIPDPCDLGHDSDLDSDAEERTA